MTASAISEAKALPRGEAWTRQIYSAGYITTPPANGTVVVLADGLIGIVSNLSPYPATGWVTVRVVGEYDVLSSDAHATYTDGGPVYWDTVALHAYATMASNRVFMGTFRDITCEPSFTGHARVRVLLNGSYSILNDTALTFTGTTGANAITIPDNLAVALYIKDSSAGVIEAICTTNGSESRTFSLAGNEVLTFTQTASAVNYFDMKPAATGGGPTLSAAGDDTDVDINLKAKGAGIVKVDTAATPAISLVTGMTNTGYFEVLGKTSGGLRVTTADATAYLVTVTLIAQTTGTAALSIPNFNNVADTFAFITLAQELANKTMNAMVVKAGLTASGSASNDFSSSTGTFKTSTGLNTLGGLAALKAVTTPVAAAGSAVGDAGQLGSANTVHITSDSAGKGVKLGTGALGQRIEVLNDSATAAKLYAAAGGTINGLAPDAAVVIPASKGVLCHCTAADTWLAYDLPAKATTA